MLSQTNQILRSIYYSTRYQRGLDQFILPTKPAYNYKNQICFDKSTLRASYYVKTDNPLESNFYIVTPKVKSKSPLVDEIFLL